MRNKEKIYMPKDRFTLFTIDDTSLIPPKPSQADIRASEKKLAKEQKKAAAKNNQ